MNEQHKRSTKNRRNAFLPFRYDHEQQKLIKQKARARRADPTRAKEPRRKDWRLDDDEDEAGVPFEKIRTGRDRVALTPAAPILLPPDDVAPTPVDGATPALVLSVQRGGATVRMEGRSVTAELASSIAATQQTSLAVGDEVLVSRRADDALRIEAVQPRRTVLSRPDPGNAHRMRVLAANIDVAVLVLSVKAPPFRPALIDRFLIAIGRGGVQPLLCINKLDLLDDRAPIEAALAPYLDLDIDVVLASAETGEGIEPLRAALAGLTCVFVGHSGVGKSSLLNAIDPGEVRATKTGREFDGKGRHTTTSSTLVELPDGTRVIDTPGIRTFGLWDVDRDGLRHEFPEFVEPASRCRFGDCTHLHEPDCAVRAAVDAGEVARARYGAYLRILDTLP